MKQGLSQTAAKDRRRLVRQISSALLGPIGGKMPKSSIESLEKFSFLPNIESHIVDIVTLSEAEVVRHDVGADFPPFIRKEAVFAKRNLYLLRDAVASPNSGLVWVEDRILEESVGSLRRIMGWGDVLHEPLLPVTELRLKEPVVVCHPASYYHWLLEVLPNLLAAISRFPEVRIVIPEDSPGYVVDGLTTFLGPGVAERFIVCSNPVRVDTLVMPQYHALPEFTNPQTLQLLRSEVESWAAREDRGEVRPGGMIYVSRRKSRRRRLKREDLLEAKLLERGVEVIHCEELSLRDQVRIFRDATTVVGTHGAGLSNLVWSEAPCRVIEIFPRNYILDCFSWLSFSLGFDYRYVICDTGHQIDDAAMEKVLEML